MDVETIDIDQRAEGNPTHEDVYKRQHEERRMHDAMRRDALKRRKVEVLDISHNDRVQREADFTSSIETTPDVYKRQALFRCSSLFNSFVSSMSF